ALFSGEQRGRVDARKRPLRRKGIRKQFAAFDAVAHILQQALKILIPLPLDQQIQRIEDRQPSLDQRQELLVEDYELALLNLAPPPDSEISRQQSARLDPINQQPLLHQPVAALGLGIAVLDMLEKAATFVGGFDQEFSHASCGECGLLPSLASAYAKPV